jgi:HK97 family phage major capsid protein
MPDITLQEVKKSMDEMLSSVEELKKTNEAYRKKLDANGHADPLFNEKLDKINEAISREEAVQREWRRQQEAAKREAEARDIEKAAANEAFLRQVDAKISRAALGLGGAGGFDEKADERLHRKAYNVWLRKGEKDMKPEELKVLPVSNDSTGGYLAPPTFAAEIIKAAVLYSPMRDLVTVRQIGTGEFQQPKRTSTAAATRQSELGTRAETTNPAWGLVKIPAPEMYAEARITWANLEDSAFNLEQLLTDEFAEQFGVKEGTEVISGNGVNACLGILDANAAGPSVPIAYTPSGSAATIKGADGSQADGLINLFHAVKTAYATRGSWALNRGSLGKVRLLQDTTGQKLWQPALSLGVPPTILGAPYTECPDMPDEGSNTFPIAFGDWKRAYTMVERVDIVMTRDPYTVASAGQVKFFARRRVGGQVVLGEALRLLKCATS